MSVTLSDGKKIFCLKKIEAITLDRHVTGYFKLELDNSNKNIIFDVGANIGIFSIRAIEKYPNASVFSFEPLPQIFKVLEKNAELHGNGQIITLPYGVSYQNKSMPMQYYPHCPALSTSYPELWSKNDNTFFLAFDGAINNTAKELWGIKLIPKFLKKWFAKWLRSKPITVNCQLRTITSIIDKYQIDHIDLLKIDCEGAELDVLKGIKEQHWEIIKSIIIEVHNVEGRLKTIMDLLTQHGLTEMTVETEKGFENTNLRNIYASRP